jgi:osmotically inducible protein OsmC
VERIDITIHPNESDATQLKGSAGSTMAKIEKVQARLNVGLPGLERAVAQTVVDGAHQTCPYSKATRGNIDVVINLV